MSEVSELGPTGAPMPDKTTVAGELPRLPSKLIEQGWHDTFSTNNPFCPCTLKTFEKSVGWAHRHYEALATAALAQKDGEIERLREALRRLLDAENDAHLTIQGVRNLARAALGSQI